ncbi:MAG: hypothetical protein DYG98_03580 [Haliscomenobacteraceae bacterium CHB4]|nr:hypothetical protein [Haliscomenobacteraceae bacterium CHB4]
MYFSFKYSCNTPVRITPSISLFHFVLFAFFHNRQNLSLADSLCYNHFCLIKFCFSFTNKH